jgi:hypothetical protein
VFRNMVPISRTFFGRELTGLLCTDGALATSNSVAIHTHFSTAQGKESITGPRRYSTSVKASMACGTRTSRHPSSSSGVSDASRLAAVDAPRAQLLDHINLAVEGS